MRRPLQLSLASVRGSERGSRARWEVRRNYTSREFTICGFQGVSVNLSPSHAPLSASSCNGSVFVVERWFDCDYYGWWVRSAGACSRTRSSCYGGPWIYSADERSGMHLQQQQQAQESLGAAVSLHSIPVDRIRPQTTNNVARYLPGLVLLLYAPDISG